MNTHRKLYLPVLLLVLFTIGLELLNIHLSGVLASDSVNVKKIQANIAHLSEENEILNTQVLSETSFESLSQKAKLMGFVEDHSYISLQNQVKFSYRQ